MAQNITLLGASYTDVPSVLLPKTGGGTAQFDDTTDANASASDIASGKTAYVNGTKLTGTASGGGNTYISGSVSFSSTHDTNENVEIVSLSTIGFTPSKFFMVIDDESKVSSIQYAVLNASFETGNDNSYYRSVIRHSNTSGGRSIYQNADSWTNRANGHLYNDGSKIHLRTTSGYILHTGTKYNWIAIP